GRDRGHLRNRHQRPGRGDRQGRGDGAASRHVDPSVLGAVRGRRGRGGGEDAGGNRERKRGGVARTMDPTFAIEVETVASILDQLDYFQILKVAPDASEREIKTAYYREARIFHPD